MYVNYISIGHIFFKKLFKVHYTLHFLDFREDFFRLLSCSNNIFMVGSRYYFIFCTKLKKKINL